MVRFKSTRFYFFRTQSDTGLADSLLAQWHSLITWRSLCLALLVFVFLFLFIDKPLAVFFHHQHIFSCLPPLVDLLSHVSWYVIAFFLLGLYLRFVKGAVWAARDAFFMGAWMMFAYLLCSGFKVLLGRARPELWFSKHIFGFYGWQWGHAYHSFPSGHTTVFMSLTLGLAYFFPRYGGYVLLLGLLLSLTRVIFAHHYLSDVIGTSILIFIAFVWARRTWLKSLA